MAIQQAEQIGSSSGYDTEVLFGPINLSYVPYDAIVEMPAQVRSEYDTEALQELADAMVHVDDDGIVAFELINPLLIARLDQNHFDTYTEKHRTFYGLESTAYQFEPASDGFHYVSISGHRRRRAIHIVANRHDIATERIQVASIAHTNITFESALELQLRENVHLRPDPVDEARTLERIKSSNPDITVKQMAQRYGMTEGKVRDALRFASLPEAIQQNVTAKTFSYTHALQLAPLHEAYKYFYRIKAELNGNNTEVDEFAAASTEAYMNFLITKRLDESTPARTVSDMIKAKVNDIRGEAEYMTGELFVDQDASPVRIRDYHAQEVARVALRVLGLQARAGVLTESQRESLMDLTAQVFGDELNRI